jgi:hypothetical protein
MWLLLVFSFDKVDFHCREHIPARMVKTEVIPAPDVHVYEPIAVEMGRAYIH